MALEAVAQAVRAYLDRAAAPADDPPLLTQNLLAVRSSELFVAGARGIAVFDLRRWRPGDDAATTTGSGRPTQQTLLWPERMARVRGLVVNDKGTWAAVLVQDGTVRVAAVGHRRLAKHRDVTCKWTTLAGAHLADPAVEVLKAAWHPLSEHDTHLLLLLSGSVLCIYDVAADHDQPETTIALRGGVRDNGRGTKSPGQPVSSSPQRGRFAAPLDDDHSDDDDDNHADDAEAVSFAIGRGEAWTALTVYVLLRDGRVGAVCPVLPSGSAVAFEQLRACEAVLRSGGATALQLEWLRQLECSLSSALGPGVLVVKAPEDLRRLRPVLQPLQQPQSLQPSTASVAASDIAFVPGVVAVLATAFTDGVITAAALLGQPQPRWASASSGRTPPPQAQQLLALATVDCALGRAHADLDSAVLLTLDESLDRDAGEAGGDASVTLLASHGRGAHALALPSLDGLSDGVADLELWEQLRARSLLETDGRNLVFLLGFAVVRDLVRGHAALALTHKHELHVLTLNGPDGPAEDAYKPVSHGVSPARVSSGKPTPFETKIDGVLAQVEAQMRPVIDDKFNEAGLADVLSKHKQKIVAGPLRVLEQEIQHQRAQLDTIASKQSDQLMKLAGDVRDCGSRTAQLQARLDKTRGWVQKYQAQVEALLLIVADMRPVISDQERHYFQFLRDLHREKRVLHQRLTRVRVSMDESDVSALPEPVRPGAAQLESLTAMLNDNTGTVQDLSARLESVRMLVEAIPEV